MADPESLSQHGSRVAAYWVVPWPSFREIAQKSLNDDHKARLVWCVRRSRQIFHAMSSSDRMAHGTTEPLIAHQTQEN
jgi:hypothetical protein